MKYIVKRRRPDKNVKQLSYLSKQIEYLQRQINSLIKSKYKR